MVVGRLTAEIDLLDVNVWVALSVSEHPHAARAHRYWQQETRGRLAFCRPAALAYLRLITNTTVMAGLPLRAREAWTAYQTWLNRAEVVAAPEPAGLDAVLAGWAGRNLISSRVWPDAYLAAFAISGGFRFVSFDRDFLRFDGLDLLRLEV